jgi:hypothetical protein
MLDNFYRKIPVMSRSTRSLLDAMRWYRDATWDPAEPHKTTHGWGGGQQAVDEIGAAQLSPLGEICLAERVVSGDQCSGVQNTATVARAGVV